MVLAERGVEAERAARRGRSTAYRRFMSEVDPDRRRQAGKDLIRSILGKDAIAEDSLL